MQTESSTFTGFIIVCCCCCCVLLLLFLGGGGEKGPDLMIVLSIRLNQSAALYHLLVNCVQCLTRDAQAPGSKTKRLTNQKKKEKLVVSHVGQFSCIPPSLLSRL